MVEIIAQTGRAAGPPKTKAPVEVESAPETDDTEVVKDTITTPTGETLLTNVSAEAQEKKRGKPTPTVKTVPPPVKISDAGLQGATDEELRTLISQMKKGSELEGRVVRVAASRGLSVDPDDTEPAQIDTEVDEIVLAAGTLSDLGGDPDAIAGIKFDRVEVVRTSTTKRTLGYLNGESTIISEEDIDPSDVKIEQRVVDNVSYDVEIRDDGSEWLRGRSGNPTNGQPIAMLQPPNIPGAVPSAEPDEPEEEVEVEVEVEDPPVRGPDEPTPPAEGRLRPTGEHVVSANRKVFLDEHGREQIEQMLTVQDSRINGGRPTNIPTVYDGVALRKEDAIQAAMASGLSFESFRSEEEAAEGIVRREAQIGRERDTVEFLAPVVSFADRLSQNVAFGLNKSMDEMASIIPGLADVFAYLDEQFPELVIPLERPTTPGGEMLSTAVQLMAPMVGFAKVFSFMSPIWRWAMAGGIADFAAMSPDEKLMFPELLEAMGELDNKTLDNIRLIMIEGLKKDADDSETIKRLANMKEGLAIGLAIDGLIVAFPLIKRLRMPGPFGTVGRTVATAAATTLALALSSDSAEASMAKRVLDSLKALGHEPAGPFFSVLIKRLEDSRQGSATGEQWMKMIDGMTKEGVKKEERLWTGVDDFLEEHKFRRVTRQELIEYLQKNKVEIEEVNLGPEFGQTLEQAEQMARDAEEANRRARNAQLDAADGPRHQFGTPEEQEAARERLSDAQQALGATTNADPAREALVQEFEEAQNAMREIVPGWGRAAGSAADPAGTPIRTIAQLPGAIRDEINILNQNFDIEARILRDDDNPTGPSELFFVVRTADDQRAVLPSTMLDEAETPEIRAAVVGITEAFDRGVPGAPAQAAPTPGAGGQTINQDANILDANDIGFEVNADGTVTFIDRNQPDPELRRMTLEVVDDSQLYDDAVVAAAARIEDHHAASIAGAQTAPPGTFLDMTPERIAAIREGAADDILTLEASGLRFDPPVDGNSDEIFSGVDAGGNLVPDARFTLEELRTDLMPADEVIEAAERLDQRHTEAVTGDAPAAPAAGAENILDTAGFDAIAFERIPDSMDIVRAEGWEPFINAGGELRFRKITAGPAELDRSTDELVELADPADELVIASIRDIEELFEGLPQAGQAAAEILDTDSFELIINGALPQVQSRLAAAGIDPFIDPDSGRLLFRSPDGTVNTAAELEALLGGEQRILEDITDVVDLFTETRRDMGEEGPTMLTDQVGAAPPAVFDTERLGDLIDGAAPNAADIVNDAGYNPIIMEGNLFFQRWFGDQTLLRPSQVYDREAGDTRLRQAVLDIEQVFSRREEERLQLAETALAAANELSRVPVGTPGFAAQVREVARQQQQAGVSPVGFGPGAVNMGTRSIAQSPVLQLIASTNSDAFRTMMRADLEPRVDLDGLTLRFQLEDDVASEMLTTRELVDGFNDNQIPGFAPAEINEARAAAIELQHAFDRIHGVELTALPVPPRTSSVHERTFRPVEQSTWVLGGGANYREILITLPRNRETQWEVFTGQGDSTELIRSFPNRREAQAFIDDAAASGSKQELRLGEQHHSPAEAYTGGHFDDENVLVHMRLNERVDVNGKKILHIEEFQSDWFQGGRKVRTKRVKKIAEEQGISLEEANKQVPRNYGFKTPETTADIVAANRKSVDAARELDAAVKRFQNASEQIVDDAVQRGRPFSAREARREYAEAELRAPPTGRFGDISDLNNGEQPTSAVMEAWIVQNHLTVLENAAEMASKRQEHLANVAEMKFPDAPFKNTWNEIAFRRVLRYAAEHDFDGITWTTGKQQVDRYSNALREQVDKIEWSKDSQGVIHIRGSRDGHERVDTKYKENDLSDAIGKAMAKRIIEDPSQTGTIAGRDITIDDIGMAGFYDRMMVTYANKFGKKFGKTTTGETSLPTRSNMLVQEVEADEINRAIEAAAADGEDVVAEILRTAQRQLAEGIRPRRAFGNVTEAMLEKYLPAAIHKPTRETVHYYEVNDKMRETALSEGFPLFNLAVGATGATAAAAAAAGGTARPAEARSTAGQGIQLPGADDVDLGGGTGNDQLIGEGPLPGRGVDRGRFGKPSIAAGKGQQVAAGGAAVRFIHSLIPAPDVPRQFRDIIKIVKGRAQKGQPIVKADKATYKARNDARKDNLIKVGPRKGEVKGVPVNDNRVIPAPAGSGKPDYIIGTPTANQKRAFLEHMLTSAERAEARVWYSSVRGVFEDAFGPDEGQVRMISWMLANQNVSPTQALQNVLKITEEITDVGSRGGQVGVKISQGGLSHDAVGAFLRGKPVEKGLGQKLIDFVDSGLGRDSRSFYGNDPTAGAPYTADIHAIRGGGMVDQTTLTSLEKQGYDITGIELDFKGGAGQTSPDVHQYEHVGNWGRRMTEELNAQGFMGGDLTPAELQAIDWMAMTKMIGEVGQTPQQAVDNNIIRVMYEARPASGSALNNQFGADLAGLDRIGQVSVNAAVTRKAAEIIGEELGADVRAFYHGTGGWTNKGVVEVSPSTVVELLASPAKADAVADGLALLSDQKEIWTAMAKPKLSKKPENAAIHVIEMGSTKMASDEMIAKVWLAIQEADPTKIIGGFAPLVRPDGSVGMTILIRARELEGNIKGELKSRQEDIKRIVEGDVHDILDKALESFDFNMRTEIEEVGINVRRNDFEVKGKENGQDHKGRLDTAGRGDAANRIVSRRGELEAVYRKSIDEAKALQTRTPKAGGGGEGPRPSEVSLRVQQKVLDQERINGTLKPDDPRLEAGEYDAMSKRLGLLTTGAVVASAAGFGAAGEAEAALPPGGIPGQPESQQIGIPPPPDMDVRLAGFWQNVMKPFIGRAGRERLRNTPESFEARMVKQQPDPGVVEAVERSWDEYREMDKDLFGDPVPTEGIDFNLSRMNTTDDVNQQINNVSRLYEKDFKETTGGVIPHDLTRQVADLIGVEPEAAARAVQSLPSDVSDLHIRALVMRDMMVQAANDIDRRAIAMGADPSQVSDAEALAFREAHARFVLLARQLKGVGTDIARGLSAYRIIAEDMGNVMERAAATQEALNAHGGRSAALDLADKWLKTPNDKKAKLNPSLWAKTRASIFEIWINGLLSSTRTHEVNFGGNNIFTIWQIPERVQAGAFGMVRQLLPNSNPDRVFMREGAALLHGYLESVPAGFKLAWETWKSGKPTRGLTKMENASRESISAQAWGADPSSMLGRFADILGAFVRIPGKFLMTADEFNRALGHGAERRAQAFRRAQIILDDGGDTKTAAEAYADVMGGKIPDVEKEITEFGDLVTFTKQLGEGGQLIQKIIGRFPILKLVVPFFRTPTNLFKEFIKRTPLAPALKEVRADWVAGGAKRDLALSRISMGTGVLMFGHYLAGQGIITGGGPTDRRMRTVWLRAGNQPYSIKIGDSWYPYGRLEPMATVLGVAADFAEYQKWAPADVDDAEIDHVAIQALGSVMHTVSQKTFLLGISELAAAYSDPERYAGDFVSRITGSASPYSSFLRDVETAVDRPRRAVESDPRDSLERRGFDAALNQLKERTPGFSKSLPERLNFWGEEILAFDGEWYHAFNAYRPRKIKKSVVDDELLRLRYPLAKPRGEIEGVTLTPRQNHDFIKAYNDIKLPNSALDKKRQTMREMLEWQVTKSKAYAGARSDEDKMKLLRKVRDAFVNAARGAMVSTRTKYYDADLDERVRGLKSE